MSVTDSALPRNPAARDFSLTVETIQFNATIAIDNIVPFPLVSPKFGDLGARQNGNGNGIGGGAPHTDSPKEADQNPLEFLTELFGEKPWPLVASNYPPAEPGALFSVSRSKRLEGDADASPAHCAT